MKTGLTNRLLNIYEKDKRQLRNRTLGERAWVRYTENFNEFCESMLLTDLLKDEEKFIIRKLLKQWEMNQK